MSAGEVEVRAGPDGASLVAVRAQPGAKRRGPAGIFDGCLKLAVCAPAADGRANAELVELAAELFGLRPSGVTLVRGHSGRRKTLRLELAPDVVRARLALLLQEPS